MCFSHNLGNSPGYFFSDHFNSIYNNDYEQHISVDSQFHNSGNNATNYRGCHDCSHNQR